EDPPADFSERASVHDSGPAMGAPIGSYRRSIRSEHIRSSDVELSLRVFSRLSRHFPLGLQCEIAEGLGVNVNAIEECIHGGAALARRAGGLAGCKKDANGGKPELCFKRGAQKVLWDCGFPRDGGKLSRPFAAPPHGGGELVLTPPPARIGWSRMPP